MKDEENMICRLCLQEKKLQNSHIIPEFFYKPLYDEIHRFNVLSTVEKEKNRIGQKGIREKLLCRACEQKLSKLERYVSQVFWGGTEIIISRKKNIIKLSNIDYSVFKLFQFSLLWRASVSTAELFSRIKLAPRHEEKLRTMIIENVPGEPHEYGCMINILMADKNNMVTDLILSPESLRIYGHKCYRFVLGGAIWCFVVSSHSKSFPFKDLFLSKDGVLTIILVNADDTELFQKLAMNLKFAGKI